MKRGPHSPATGHPDLGVLLEFVEEQLPSEESRRISGHLHACPDCRAEATRWARLLGLLAAERADAPAPALSEWARRIPRTLAPGRRTSLLRLVADSWAGFVEGVTAALRPPVAALRSATASRQIGRRRLLFSEPAFDLDLEIGYVSADDSRQVHGQLLPHGEPRATWAGTEVILRSGAKSAGRVRLDRRGEFRLKAVVPGRYRLAVNGHRKALTPPFEI